MVDLRKDKRAPASLKVKYKSATVDEFLEQVGTDISRGGIFIKTKKPIENGAVLKLELQLNDASPVIHGIGRVCWRREQVTDPELPAGMGIKFIKLDPDSRTVVERVVQARGDRPSRFDQTIGAELAAPSQPPLPAAPPVAQAKIAPETPAIPRAPLAPSPVSPRAPVAPSPAARAPAIPPPAAGRPPQAAPRIPIPPAPAASPRAAAPAPLDLPPPPANVLRGGAAPAPAAKPAIAPSVAGLFASSPLVTSSPSLDPGTEGPKRTSFFPPSPNTNGTASARPSVPGFSGSGRLGSPASASSSPRPKSESGNLKPGGRADQTRQSGQFLAAAFAEGGVAEETATQARAVADHGEDALIDELFAGVVHERPQSQPSLNVREPPVSDIDTVEDVFAELSEEEGLGIGGSSRPGARASDPLSSPAALRRASMPGSATHSAQGQVNRVSSEFDVHGPEPLRSGHAAAPAPAPGAPFVDEDEGLATDTGQHDPAHAWNADGSDQFGEADLFGSLSPPPSSPSAPPSLPLSAADAGAPTAKSTTAGARKSSSLLFIVVGLVLALCAAAGFFYYQTSVASRRADVHPVAEAPSAVPPAPIPAAPTQPSAEPAKAEPPPAAGAEVAKPEQAAAEKPAAPAQAENAPAPAPVPTIEVEVSALPRDSDISVNGKRVGTTPKHVALPLDHEASVTISSAGYAPMTKTVVATKGMEPLRFKLEPLPYTLVVRTTPEAAAVSVGQRSAVSPAPLELGHLEGGVQVGIAKEGYQRMTRLVRIDEFVEQGGVMKADVEVALSPLPAAAAPRVRAKRARPKAEADTAGDESPHGAPPAPEPPSPNEAAPAPSEPAPPTSAASKPVPEGAAPQATPPATP